MEVLESAKRILQAAGWYEGRKIDITEMIKLLEGREFEVFPKAEEFLEEFSALEIIVKCNHSQEVIKKYMLRECDIHHTNVFKALGDSIFYSYAQQFEFFAGEKLVIVGSISNDNLFLMVSETGKIYCDSGKLGDDVWEAWDTLFNLSEKGIIGWQYL